MKNYTVTIAPDDGEGATTVVKLQLDGSTPLIKELTLSAGNNAGLAIGQLPVIDLGALLAAVMPAATTSPVIADIAAAPSPMIAAPPADDVDGLAPASPVPVTVAQPVSVARTAPPVTTRRTRANTAPATKAAGATKAPAAKKAAAGKKTQPAKPGRRSAAHTGPNRERAYRVMPEDFVNTFGKTTMADLAEVYQVPRHTIQGWVNTARKHGKIPPARSRSAA